MRRWFLEIYADHTDRTRRVESLRPFSGFALRSPRSEGLGRLAPALRTRQRKGKRLVFKTLPAFEVVLGSSGPMVPDDLGVLVLMEENLAARGESAPVKLSGRIREA
jgi:hypothetical protein